MLLARAEGVCTKRLLKRVDVENRHSRDSSRSRVGNLHGPLSFGWLALLALHEMNRFYKDNIFFYSYQGYMVYIVLDSI